MGKVLVLILKGVVHLLVKVTIKAVNEPVTFSNPRNHDGVSQTVK